MRINLFLVLFITFFTSKTFAQDCNCKHWKKTYYNNYGEVRYEYDHGCYQPGSAWEYIGYDEAYCKQLIDEHKRRIENVKKTKEAIEISKNTKKQLNKDGYKVISWYGKFLGNTGKWDNVGSPRFGIDEDSTFVEWDEYGQVVIRGRIKNKNLYGILEIYENGNEYLDPKGLIQYIIEYLNIGIQSWKPNVIYFNEIEKYESEKESLKNGVEQTLYGIYFTRINGQKKYFSHYYIGNGFVTLFSSPIDEKKASVIHNEFVKIQITKEINFIKDSYKQIEERINQIKESINIKLIDSQQNPVLTELESKLVGNWNFKSNIVLRKKSPGGYYYIKEQIILNNNRTYKYEGDCLWLLELSNSYAKPVVHTTNTGTWEINDNKIVFTSTPSEENLPSYDLIDSVSNRLREKIKILDEIDQTNINLNILNIIDEKIIFLSLLELAKKDENNIKMSIFFSLFDGDEELGKEKYMLYKQFTEFEKIKNIMNEVRFDQVSQKKITRKNINFKETLVYKLNDNKNKINDISLFHGIEDVYFELLKGKKQN
jgi:hypothetical protein